MLKFSALVPDATVNYIKNPSLRYDATDWNADGSTITRSLEQARFGIASLKVVTNGTALRQGAYYRVNALQGISEPITVSAYVRGAGRVRIRLINNPTGAEWASASIQLESGYWQRISVSGFSTGSNDLRLYVETQEGVAAARTFYVDGAQMERKSYPTTYCDGDQPGCRWNGLYHASTSQRAGDTRAGGRWVQLAGEEREAQDLYMTVVTGLGKAPLTNNIQTFALEAGAYFQNKKVNVRSITLTFHAKHKIEDQETPISLAALHQLRQLLIDLVKPDRTGGDEEIWFEYFDGNTPLYFQARYDGGLEGEWDIRNQFVNSFPLRLLAVSPMMLEDSQEVSVLDFQDSISTNHTAGRLNGRWTNLNFGFNDDAVYLALGTRGEIFAFAQDNGLTLANNNAQAVDPLRPVRAVTYWDGEKWNALGPVVAMGGGGLSGPTQAAVAPNGDVYVVGNFSSIGGTAANNIARWDGSSWNALGTGTNGLVSTIVIAQNGDVYIGGQFTTAGGVACLRIARWDGSSWRRLGQYGGLNAAVTALGITPDGLILYAGGSFTDENGNPGSGLTRVASYNVESGLFSSMGSGFDNTPNVFKISPSGTLYTAGIFINSGSAVLNRVAKWNGSTWVAMANGVCSELVAGVCTGGIVRDMAIFADGNVLIVGEFNRAGNEVVSNMAVWNGSKWLNSDVETNMSPATDSIYSCLIHPETQDIFLVWVSSVAPLVFEVPGFTAVANPGTAETRPSIYVKGPGTLRWIENQTTRKRIYLNLQILVNEEVFFDFAVGKVFSTVRGSLFHAILPGSDFRSFSVIPGENIIACLMINDVGAQMQLSLTPIHWSADATQHGEIL